MIILIAGSRGLDPEPSVLHGLVRPFYTDSATVTILSGGARGVDRAAERYAEHYGHRMQVMYADWEELGKGAGYIRNAEMVSVADAAVIMWDGESGGTAHTLRLVQDKDIPYSLVNHKSLQEAPPARQVLEPHDCFWYGCDDPVLDAEDAYCENHTFDQYGVRASQCYCHQGHDIISDPPEVCHYHDGPLAARLAAELAEEEANRA